MGSEMPIIAPSAERSRICFVLELDGAGGGRSLRDFVPRTPRQKNIKRVRRPPKIMPGKKPAATALAGKATQVVVVHDEFEFELEAEIEDVSPAEEEEEDAEELLDEVVVAAVVAEFCVMVASVAVAAEEAVDDEEPVSAVVVLRMQRSLLHEYPNGQHELPQAGSVPSSLVVFTLLSG